jgi:hypothetical protein
VLGSLGYPYVLQGRLRLMHEALGGREPKAWRVGLGRVLVRLAESHVIAGRLTEARDVVERCLEFEAAALRLLGEIALRDGSGGGLDAAAEHFQHAIAQATELGQRPLVARCHEGLGRLHRRRRRRAKAEEHAAVKESMYRAMSMSGSGGPLPRSTSTSGMALALARRNRLCNGRGMADDTVAWSPAF